MPDVRCVSCSKPIEDTDDKTTIEGEPYHAQCWDREIKRIFAERANRQRPGH